jgi:hypothetical protein
MTTGNTAPLVSTSNTTLPKGQSVAISTRFSSADADADIITQYEFWDSGTHPGSGRIRIGGTPQAQNVAITVAAANLADTTLAAGSVSGTESIWVRAFDGYDWSLWKSFTLTTTNQVPNVTASNANVTRNAQVLASSLFSVSDADGDAITQYEFWDSGTTSGSGYFAINGIAQAASASIAVNAADLATIHYVGGTGPGGETVWVRASDGSDWSAWRSWTMTTVGSAPIVSANNRELHVNQSIPATNLFTVFDPDSDPITHYEFWDSGTGVNSGRFTIGGAAQGQNVAIAVLAANLAEVSYVSASVNGTETVWVRAADATGFGTWTSWDITTGNTPPTITSSDITTGKNQIMAMTTYIIAIDANLDSIVQYEFWDSGSAAGSGEFRVNGVAKPANVAIAVSAGDLINTIFATASGPGQETIWARAHDGYDWGAWKAIRVTTTNSVPVVVASNANIARNTPALASSLFSVSDADGDAITQYELWDSGTAANSGYFAIAGTSQAANVAIPVLPGQLTQTTYVGGSVIGSEQVWARANDGTGWSNWTSWMMGTTT